MATRMERYKKNETTSRTDKNKKLYNSIYSYGKYSNIEGIASIDKTNEIDITKVKEMLDNREKYQAERRYRKVYNEEVKEEKPVVKKRYSENIERTYDIMDVLSKAKENKTPDDKERVLNQTSYEALKKLNIQKEESKEDIKEMIDSITTTSSQNKDDDMFSDLKATNNDTKVSDVKDIKEFMDSKKEQTMDNSFFTSSLRLKKADFINYNKEEKSGFRVFLIVVLVIAIIITIGIIVVERLGLL